MLNDELAAESQAVDSTIYRFWNEWMRAARWAKPFAHPEMRQSLARFEADWLKLAAT
jgi:hypothetical protein